MKKQKRTLEDLKNSTLIPAMLVPERIPVSLATVRSWIFQGKLPVVKIGRMVFILWRLYSTLSKLAVSQ